MAAYYRVSQEVLDKAQIENERGMQEMKEDMRSGLFQTGYEGIRNIGGR